jgi:hypothetical protein
LVSEYTNREDQEAISAVTSNGVQDPRTVRIRIDSDQWLFIVVFIMTLSWVIVGTNLYRGVQPLWDEADYLKWAGLLQRLDFTAFAKDLSGTLVRPIGYPLFLALATIPIGGIASPASARFWITLVQLVFYVASSLFLYYKLRYLSPTLARCILVATLALPFPIFTQVEILSESVSLSLFYILTATAMSPIRFGGGLGILIQFVPFTLATALFSLLRAQFFIIYPFCILYLVLISLRRVYLDYDRRRQLWLIASLFTAIIVSVVPILLQLYVLSAHDEMVPNDPKLYGVGVFQLENGLTSAKYATFAIKCPGVSAGIRYNNPFMLNSGKSAFYLLQWYVAGPVTALIHLFQSINHDFPTTYITTLSPLITVPFNLLSAAMTASGLVALWANRRFLLSLITIGWARSDSMIMIIPVVVLVLFLQCAVLCVETRFGIIPWTAGALSGLAGARQWVLESQAWSDRKRQAFAVVGITTLLVAASRLMITWAPELSKAYAQGC